MSQNIQSVPVYTGGEAVERKNQTNERYRKRMRILEEVDSETKKAQRSLDVF